MSLSTAAARTTAPLRAPRRAPSRPPLRLVEAGARQVSRVPFLVLCAALLMSGLVAVLVLNTTLSQGSFTLAELQTKAATLDDQELALRQDIDAVSSSGNLAAAAAGLGMAPASEPMFLDPETGRVSGVAPEIKQAQNFTVVTGRAAVAPLKAPTDAVADATSASAGLGLGGGLFGAVASLSER